ncbi:hypothetical protein EGT59_24685 [Burkholderia mallei]|nr:hypothetical protein EGT59_24685 [Burkholderia mallei]
MWVRAAGMCVVIRSALPGRHRRRGVKRSMRTGFAPDSAVDVRGSCIRAACRAGGRSVRVRRHA